MTILGRDDPDDPDDLRRAESEVEAPPERVVPPAATVAAGRPRRRLRRLPRAPVDEEFVEVKPDSGPWRKLIAILFVFALVIGVLVGGAYWWYRRQVNPPGPAGAAISVVINQGTSTNGIAKLLEHDGVISNKTVFEFYVRRKHAGPFQAGRFVLRENSDFDSVIRVLKRGPAPADVVRVNIPEGLTLTEMANKLHRSIPRFFPSRVRATLASGAVKSSLRQGKSGSWEGLLFPASYDVGPHTDLAALLSRMALTTEQVTRSEGLKSASAAVARKFGIRLTPYEAFIVASLIQREAGNDSEAPLIATVIYNRLRQHIALGIDATSRYWAAQTGTKVDFSSRSSYNTRRQKGLPPTPIAAPSRAALHAALHPATGPWLYYVLTSPGHHTFAVTNDQFLAAKRICKARRLGCG